MASQVRRSSVQDCDLFGEDSGVDPLLISTELIDEQVQHRHSKSHVSERGEKGRNHFRSSRDSTVLDLEDTNDDVFDDNITSTVTSVTVRRCKSESALPDLILSSNYRDKQKIIHRNGSSDEDQGVDSPDIIQDQPNLTDVRRKSILVIKEKHNDSSKDEIHDLPANKQKPQFKRSVSFQEQDFRSKQVNVRQKRDSYRKSSGYGTGGSSESKSSSVQSQCSQNSCQHDPALEVQGTSLFDNEFENQSESKYTKGNDNPLPNFLDSLRTLSYTGDKNSVKLELMGQNKQRNTDYCQTGVNIGDDTGCNSAANQQYSQLNQLPMFTELYSASTEDEENLYNLNNVPENHSGHFNYNNSQIIEENTNSQNPTAGLPNFDELLSNLPVDDSSVQLPSDVIPERIAPAFSPTSIPGASYVYNNYIDNQDQPDKTSPPFDHYINSENFTKTSCVSPLNNDNVPKKDMSLGILQLWNFCMTNLHVFDKTSTCISDLLDLMPRRMLSNSSISPSPHDQYSDHQYVSNILNRDSQNTQRIVTQECVEKRCMDDECQDTTCNLVSRSLIGLQHTLDGYWQFTSSLEVQDLCYSLYEHAQNCAEPKFRCYIPWCHVLREYCEEPPPVSVNLICHWIKMKENKPTLRDDIFPSEPPEQFIKLLKHHHNITTSFDVVCPLGHFGNVFLVSEIEPPLESFDSVRRETEDNYIVKRIYNSCESDFSQIDVYRRLINKNHDNLLAHFWIAEYPDVIHICTAFVEGGSLKELLQKKVFLCPVVVIEMINQVLDAVTFLHSCGIIYLYWTSENILIDNRRKRMLISNLSLSVTNDGQIDEGFTKQCLPPYIVPPELILGGSLCISSDCWGVACLMVEMLTGRHAWYHYRHDSKDELWRKVKSGNCNPIREVEGSTIRDSQMIAVLRKCFKINLEQRIIFQDLCTEIKEMQ